MDIRLSDLLYLAARHPEVPAAFAFGCLLFGSAAWWLAPRRGWATLPSVLAGCGIALALAVTVVRPPGQFPAGGLNPLHTAGECVVGTLSLARTYEKLNVAMLMPFAFFGTLATRRPVLIVALCSLISGFAEFVQAATGGGTCQARDLAHNTAGGVLGMVLAVLVLTRRGGRLRPRGAPSSVTGLTAGRGADPGSSR